MREKRSQTKNAMALFYEKAAVVVGDQDAKERLTKEAMKLMYDEARCRELSANIAKLGKPNAAGDIVNEIEKLIK